MAQDSLNVSVDPRIELLAVVQFLSGYQLISRKNFPYKRNISQYFSPYKSHPAVRLFAEMSEDFNYDAPPWAMLHLSDPPALQVQVPFPEYLEHRAGGRERLEQFVDLLRDFACETQFMAFFEANQTVLRPMVANVHRRVQSDNIAGTLEEYYGLKQHSYNIILAPLARGNFGPRIERSDGTYDAHVIAGTIAVIKGVPIFIVGLGLVFRSFLWHEFGHSFVNPITARFREQVNRYQPLYDSISSKMKQQAYPDWETCVNEHIIRAVTTRLAYRKYGKLRGRLALLIEKRRGFQYVEALCRQLKQYEVERHKYPTLIDFYPQLIDVFEELSRGR